MQVSLDDAQEPLHCGVSAAPQETLRHSQDPVPTAEPHREPGAHEPVHSPLWNSQPMLIPWIVVVVPPASVVVVVVVWGHGVVRARHFKMNVSRSRRGLLPLGAVAFTLSRCPRFLSLRTGTSTNVPQAEPGLGTAPVSLEFTCSFWRPVGGWHAGRFGSSWLMQTATRNVQLLFPHIPSVSHGSPSVQVTKRPPVTFGPGLSMPSTFNSTRQSDFVWPPGTSPADTHDPSPTAAATATATASPSLAGVGCLRIIWLLLRPPRCHAGPPSGSAAAKPGQGPDFAYRSSGKAGVPAEATARHLATLVESGAKRARHQLGRLLPGSPAGRAVTIVVVEMAHYGLIDNR